MYALHSFMLQPGKGSEVERSLHIHESERCLMILESMKSDGEMENQNHAAFFPQHLKNVRAVKIYFCSSFHLMAT